MNPADRETVAIDFESYYDDSLSITTQGVVNYLNETDIYLVSMSSSSGWKFTGECKDAPWGRLHGVNLVAHNAAFDGLIWHVLKKCGIIPAHVQNNAFDCSSDMGSYMGFPRALKNVMESQYGIPVNKDTRDKMKGKRWADMPPEFKEEVIRYAQADADHCLRLWMDHHEKWPEREVALSRHTRVSSWAGIPIDEPALDRAIQTLSDQHQDALDRIPWAKDSEGKPLSMKHLGEWCKQQGIPAPKSLAKDSDDLENWVAEHGDKSPVVRAMSSYRRLNTFLERATGIKRRLHDGRCSAELLYYGGGNAGRWSGSGGVNWQNQPKGEMFGVDFRSLVKAPEGYSLVVADLAQIEPRVMAVLSRDTRMLKLLKEVDDLYEAQAIAWGWWEPNKPGFRESPIRSKVKSCNLGLGYGMSPNKFMLVSKTTDREAAESLVQMWRRSNKPVVDCWGQLDKLLDRMVGQDIDFELESGRLLRYRNLIRTGDGLTSTVIQGGKYVNKRMWGSAFYQNIIQATARDLFGEAILRIARAGFHIPFHVHDEVVVLVKNEDVPEAVETIHTAMTTPPDWLPDIPLGTSVEVMRHYKK